MTDNVRVMLKKAVEDIRRAPAWPHNKPRWSEHNAGLGGVTRGIREVEVCSILSNPEEANPFAECFDGFAPGGPRANSIAKIPPTRGLLSSVNKSVDKHPRASMLYLILNGTIDIET